MTLSDDQEPHQPDLRDSNPKMILGAAALVAVLVGGWAYYLTSTERSDMAILLPGMTDPDAPLPVPRNSRQQNNSGSSSRQGTTNVQDSSRS